MTELNAMLDNLDKLKAEVKAAREAQKAQEAARKLALKQARGLMRQFKVTVQDLRTAA